jgi:hypothetical protein
MTGHAPIYYGGIMPEQAPHEPAANRPFHEVRHRNIRATIWRNGTVNGPMYNVTVSRSYRDGEEWKDSHSFAFDDLMNLAKALYDAHSVISAQHSKDRMEGGTAGAAAEKSTAEPPPGQRRPRR